MKKLILAAAVFCLFMGSIFAQSKNYVIDLADTANGKTVKIVKNPYGNNYQNENPPTFTKFFANDFPKPNDTIEVFYKFTSDVDIPAITMAVIDNSEAAKYWLEISNQYESIIGVKAGIPVQGSIKYKVTKKPIKEITVQLMYNDRIDSKLTLEKTGKKTGKQ